MKSSESITGILREHYSETFAQHGATPRGVDWGRPEDVMLRYRKMLEIMIRGQNLTANQHSTVNMPSLLDVGCGYGGLYQYAQEQGVALNYSGIDVVPEMITFASSQFPQAQFRCLDIFDLPEHESYDYVVCNGILTQKLQASIRDMDQFAQKIIRHMFAIAKYGVAFNIMTTKVNFMAPNLYYRNPVELLAFCLTEITTKVRLDHAYPLYEYTVYLYKE